MNFNNYTQKSIEAVQSAQQLAVQNSHQQMEQVHLLLALLRQEGGLIPQLLKKMDVTVESLEAAAEAELRKIPGVRTSQAMDSFYVSADVQAAFNAAEQQAQTMKDEYVSVEHLFHGLLETARGGVKELFKTYQITKERVLKAKQEVRGNQRVTTDNPEGTYDAQEKYGTDQVKRAREQKKDPEIGRDEDNNLLMERRNGKGARVMGINLEGKMAYSWMQIQAGATLQRSRYKEAEQWSENPNITPQKKMFRSPDVYGYITSTFTPVKRFSASLTGTYTGSMLVQHLAGYIPEDREEKTRDFFDLNLKLSYDFPIFKSATLQVNAGIQNIFDSYQDDFDKGAHRDAGYIYGPGIPRSYFVGCKISY